MAASLILPLMTMMIAMTSTVTSRPIDVIDLTHVVGSETPFLFGQPPFNLSVLKRGIMPDGHWYEINSFAMGEHGGTHIDAPSHYARAHWRQHQIPASNLVGPGVVVDVTEKVKNDIEYEMTTQDLMDWEEEHGRIPDGAMVLMYTGWDSRFPDVGRVFNSDKLDNFTTFRCPALHPDAAKWLVDNRNITAFGLDAPSPDRFSTARERFYPVHITLLEKDIIHLEVMANLGKLPPRGATIVVGTIKLKDGSGGPARILGLLGVDNDTSGSGPRSAMSMLTLLFVMFSVIIRNRL